jgi:integrative and conjugative element protein (TIGR02256 family)
MKIEQTLVVDKTVNNITKKFSDKLPDLESGGILLGRILPNRYIVIEDLTTPTSKDKRGLFYFERDKKTAQNIINEKWLKSEGEIIYLGEWHTHNEDIPTPSKRDLNMIKNQLKTSKMEIDFLILLIVGQKENYWGIQTKKGHKKITSSNNPFWHNISL